MRNDLPEPEPFPLRHAFTHAYLSIDARVWQLSLQQQSLLLLHRVCTLARNFRMPERLTIATHPHVSPDEYVKMAALATILEAEIDGLVSDFHARYADHMFPAAIFDPLGRVGRWPASRPRSQPIPEPIVLARSA
jgi:hypothetical protein